MKTVWESSTTRLVYAVDELPRNENYPFNWRKSFRYYDIKDREIKVAVYHQKAGGYLPGFPGVLRTGRFFVRTPKYDKNGKWLGNGRGNPGYGYTVDVPHRPDVVDGRQIIYQCNDFDTVSAHTSGANKEGIGVAFQGLFRHRSNKRFAPSRGTTGRPSQAQLDVAQDLWDNFLVPRFGLDASGLKGHFDYTKPACPGDDLEKLIIDIRDNRQLMVPGDGEGFGEAPVPEYDLGTWELRQSALVCLGFYLGPYGRLKNGVDGIAGEATRLCVECVEESAGLKVDGNWDGAVEDAVVLMLKFNNFTMDDVLALTP